MTGPNFALKLAIATETLRSTNIRYRWAKGNAADWIHNGLVKIVKASP